MYLYNNGRIDMYLVSLDVKWNPRLTIVSLWYSFAPDTIAKLSATKTCHSVENLRLPCSLTFFSRSRMHESTGFRRRRAVCVGKARRFPSAHKQEAKDNRACAKLSTNPRQRVANGAAAFHKSRTHAARKQLFPRSCIHSPEHEEQE